MAKSQLNQLSKRQILESLMQEQNQSNVTLSRLITAVARTAEIDPVRLAELFVDDKGNQEFVEKFNTAVRQKHAEAQASGINTTTEQAGIEDTSSASEEPTTINA